MTETSPALPARDATPRPQQEFETLNGGAQVPVKLEDGEEEMVLCRKLPIREMAALGQAWTKEVSEMKLYVRRNGGEVTNEWLDKLTDESWAALIKEGRRVNFLRFSAFFERQRLALTAMGNDFVETVAKVIESQG